MTEETQQKISNALAQTLADLNAWLKQLGISERQAVAIYEEAVREGGMLANLLENIGRSIITLPLDASPKLQSFEGLVRWIRSEEFSERLRNEPEPPEGTVSRLVNECKNALPTLRHRLSYAAKGGPQLRKGGRHKELTDPAIRRKICDEIKRRREPRTKLALLFKSIAREYKVSDTTIKRIWLKPRKLSSKRKTAL